MNADENELLKKKKRTAAITCLVAGVMIVASALIPGWIKSDGKIGMKAGLYGFSWCAPVHPDLTKPKGGDDSLEDFKSGCQNVSNGEFVEWMRGHGDKSAKSIFGPMGWITLATAFVAGLALLVAGIFGLQDKFIRQPIALTTVGLLFCCITLVAACVFVATKPGYIPNLGPILGLSWPFFVFGIGVVGGVAGAQMLAKAHSQVRDPYWDGIVPPSPEDKEPGAQ